MDNLAYCEHLFDDSTDGYISIIKINDRTSVKVYNTELNSLKEIIEEVQGGEDIYISPNTYYKPQRAVSNIRQYRSLFIDLDLKGAEKTETVYLIQELIDKDQVPKPSMIVDSGRGIHLYWRIKNAPYGANFTWQELEDYLYHKLKRFGSDLRATDGARVLRLPNTINSRNKTECKVLVIDNDIEYSMYDLREKYLNYKPKSYQLKFEQAKPKETKSKCISNKFFNSYSLHYSRVEDIKKLCELRNYDVEGYRNFILHCYAYWTGIYTRNIEELENKVIELNNAFKKPLHDSDIKALLRCIPKAIDKFISYEQGLRAGEVKHVTKGMRDKQGYWYKNETLIERLKITAAEQQKLKTIIGTEEKYKRNNLKRTPRNEAGLTQREQKKQDTIKEIKELYESGYESGYKQVEIAEKLNLTKGRVSQVIKTFKKV